MQVILWEDELRTINDKSFVPRVVCEVEDTGEMPQGLVVVEGELARVCCYGGGRLAVEYLESVPEAREETHLEPSIVCPHCQEVLPDSWEYSDLSEDESEEMECSSCNSIYNMTVHKSVEYSTEIKERCGEPTVLKALS